MLTLRLSLSGESVAKTAPGFLDRFGGVGMIRSEYLLRRTDEYVTQAPARTALAEYVSDVAAHFDPRPVWYRALDFWTDEANTLIGVDRILEETNPALGIRGLRRALQLPASFEQEVSALVDAARAHRNLHLLLSFVGNAAEFSRGMDMVRKLNWPNRVGSMIEIPSAVLDVEAMVAAGASNLLIGMNDLTCLMTGSARRGGFGGKMHPSVWWCIQYVRDRVGADAEWGIAGDLAPELLKQAEAYGVPYASVHYCEAPQLLDIDAAELPDVDYVSESKIKTRARIHQRLLDANTTVQAKVGDRRPETAAGGAR